MLMQFNAKFFFTSVVLSFVVGISQQLIMWLHLYRLWISVLSWISFALAPVQLGFVVLLPFGVMYIFSRRINSVPIFQSIIVSTFLGWWVEWQFSLWIDLFRLWRELYMIQFSFTRFGLFGQFSPSLFPKSFLSA